MVIWVIRALFATMIVIIVFLGGIADAVTGQSAATVVVGCLSVIGLGLTFDLLVRRRSLSALAGIFFGLLVGSVIGLGFNYIIEFLYRMHDVRSDSALYQSKDGIQLIIYVMCCYLAVVFIMRTKDDFRFIIPYVEFAKQMKGGAPLILDTSVIIDGRIADIAATGILDCPLVVPRFILQELQNIADSSDRLRRGRGRRGLDVLNKMQSNKDLDLSLEDAYLSDQQEAEPVDQKLVAFAKSRQGRIATNDYNLNKVASLRGVPVLNINDLANALKPTMLPGEEIKVRIVKPGDQPGQGVGYLEDGTMVVVEAARELLGREVAITVTSALQTSAGRMVFGRLSDDPGSSEASLARSSNDRASSRPPRPRPRN